MRTKWAGYVVSIREMRNAYIIIRDETTWEVLGIDGMKILRLQVKNMVRVCNGFKWLRIRSSIPFLERLHGGCKEDGHLGIKLSLCLINDAPRHDDVWGGELHHS
jgi:hypothetical protein